jgi:hypothetical protein
MAWYLVRDNFYLCLLLTKPLDCRLRCSRCLLNAPWLTIYEALAAFDRATVRCFHRVATFVVLMTQGRILFDFSNVTWLMFHSKSYNVCNHNQEDNRQSKTCS